MAETLEQRILRLENSLEKARKEYLKKFKESLLPIGTKVIVEGYISDVDMDDNVLPYQISVRVRMDDDGPTFDTMWVPAYVVKKRE